MSLIEKARDFAERPRNGATQASRTSSTSTRLRLYAAATGLLTML